MAKRFTIQRINGFLGHGRPPLTRINPRKGGGLLRKARVNSSFFPRNPPRVRGGVMRKGGVTRGGLRGVNPLRGPRVRGGLTP